MLAIVCVGIFYIVFTVAAFMQLGGKVSKLEDRLSDKSDKYDYRRLERWHWEQVDEIRAIKKYLNIQYVVKPEQGIMEKVK